MDGCLVFLSWRTSYQATTIYVQYYNFPLPSFAYVVSSCTVIPVKLPHLRYLNVIRFAYMYGANNRPSLSRVTISRVLL